MQKILCFGAMGVSALILLIYALDLALGIPFGRTGIVQDIVLILASALIIWQSYETYRELA